MKTVTERCAFAGVALLLIVLIAAVCPVGAASSGGAPVSDIDEETLPYEETIRRSTHIVEAVYEGTGKTDGLSELRFSVVQSLKGTAPDKVLYVPRREYPFEECTVGKTYILFLERNISLYYTHDRYVSLNILPGPETDTAYIREVLERDPGDAPDKYGFEFTKSRDITEILDVSKNIFEVEVSDVFLKSTYAPTTVYNCRVTRSLRNKPGTADIQIVFFNGTVEPGESYIVLLADTDGPSALYTLSSENSVYSLEEAAQLPELKALLTGARAENG